MKTSELRKLIREEVRKVVKESTAKPLVLTNYQRDLLKALIARQRNQEDEAAHDAVKEALEGIAKDLGLDPTIPFMEDEMFSGSENPKDAYEYAMEMFAEMQAEKGIKEERPLQSGMSKVLDPMIKDIYDQFDEIIVTPSLVNIEISSEPDTNSVKVYAILVKNREVIKNYLASNNLPSVKIYLCKSKYGSGNEFIVIINSKPKLSSIFTVVKETQI